MKICNINQFQRQMNIFITGKPYINIFENIDLVSRNIAICGSIITSLCHSKSSWFDEI